jgi:hypothetical protein
MGSYMDSVTRYSLKSISRFVFMVEMFCVSYAVGNECIDVTCQRIDPHLTGLDPEGLPMSDKLEPPGTHLASRSSCR